MLRLRSVVSSVFPSLARQTQHRSSHHQNTASMSSNHIQKVAITGASGNVGSFMTEALLKTGRHTVTAITRPDSTSKYPDGVHTKSVDYDKHESIVDALKGQDALVITLSGRSPFQELEAKLVRAAGDAGVPWILPNEWSPDSAHEGIAKDVFLFGMKQKTRKLIEEVGKSNYIGLCTGFWYEYSLAVPKNYGFNFEKKEVQFYDDGDTKICTSTWPQVGRAVAAILSLPIKPAGDNKQACLEELRNKVVYTNSFTISQKDMLASACRVTGTKESDWTITKKTAKEMYDQGMLDMKEGNWKGKGNFLYGRIFYDDGCGDFESGKGTINKLLGLPQEDLDKATEVAIERQKSTGGGFH